MSVKLNDDMAELAPEALWKTALSPLQ